jgi:hypothetical protein
MCVTDMSIFTCKTCGDVVIGKEEFRTHSRAVHDKEVVYCLDCSDWYGHSRDQYTRHRREKHTKKVKCVFPGCDFEVFPDNAGKLNEHLTTVHLADLAAAAAAATATAPKAAKGPMKPTAHVPVGPSPSKRASLGSTPAPKRRKSAAAGSHRQAMINRLPVPFPTSANRDSWVPEILLQDTECNQTTPPQTPIPLTNNCKVVLTPLPAHLLLNTRVNPTPVPNLATPPISPSRTVIMTPISPNRKVVVTPAKVCRSPPMMHRVVASPTSVSSSRSVVLTPPTLIQAHTPATLQPDSPARKVVTTPPPAHSTARKVVTTPPPAHSPARKVVTTPPPAHSTARKVVLTPSSMSSPLSTPPTFASPIDLRRRISSPGRIGGSPVDQREVVLEELDDLPSTTRTVFREARPHRMVQTRPARYPTMDEAGDSWFDHAPSLFTDVPPAPQLRVIRRSAIAGEGRREVRIIPQGYMMTKKIERCYFPDGRMYQIITYWVPDPECTMYTM